MVSGLLLGTPVATQIKRVGCIKETFVCADFSLPVGTQFATHVGCREVIILLSIMLSVGIRLYIFVDYMSALLVSE